MRLVQGPKSKVQSRIRESLAQHDVQLLDVVALTVDLPAEGLIRGEVGTVVEILSPGVFEIEFCDDEGRPYAQLTLQESELLVLRYQSQSPG